MRSGSSNPHSRQSACDFATSPPPPLNSNSTPSSAFFWTLASFQRSLTRIFFRFTGFCPTKFFSCFVRGNWSEQSWANERKNRIRLLWNEAKNSYSLAKPFPLRFPISSSFWAVSSWTLVSAYRRYILQKVSFLAWGNITYQLIYQVFISETMHGMNYPII